MFDKDIKAVVVYCANCKKTFGSRLDRFPICSCGNTISITGDKPYVVFDAKKDPTIITIISGDEKRIIPVDDEQQIIESIVNLPFEGERALKEILLSEMPSHRHRLTDYTVSELVLHSLYYSNSDIYRDIFDAGIMKAAKAILSGKKFRTYKNKNIKYNILINKDICHNDYNSYEEILIMIDCIINEYPDYVKNILIQSKVDIDMYNDLVRSTVFEPDVIVKFLGELQSISITGKEAADCIKEFDIYSNDLQKYFGMEYNYDTPIYTNHHHAKLVYNMHKKTGLLNYRKYCSNNMKQYKTYNINDFEVKFINSTDAQSLPVGLFPEDEVTSPIIGVYKDGILISAVVNISGKIMINGNQSDLIKLTLNTFLDVTGN